MSGNLARVAKLQSLAEALGTSLEPVPSAPAELVDITDPKSFAEAVLSSYEFRQYILASLKLGSLPAAVTCRLMDYAWGKPPDRVEHTGKDGKPIETITEVRRVIIHVDATEGAAAEPPYVTH